MRNEKKERRNPLTNYELRPPAALAGRRWPAVAWPAAAWPAAAWLARARGGLDPRGDRERRRREEKKGREIERVRNRDEIRSLGF